MTSQEYIAQLDASIRVLKFVAISTTLCAFLAVVYEFFDLRKLEKEYEDKKNKRDDFTGQGIS